MHAADAEPAVGVGLELDAVAAAGAHRFDVGKVFHQSVLEDGQRC